MSKHEHARTQRKPSRRGPRLLIVAGLVTATLFAGLALRELGRPPAHTASPAVAGPAPAASLRTLPATATEQERAQFLAATARLGPATAPEPGARMLPPGYVAASLVASAPNDATPAVPTASLVDPTVDLSVVNPGGVDGQRAPR